MYWHGIGIAKWITSRQVSWTILASALVQVLGALITSATKLKILHADCHGQNVVVINIPQIWHRFQLGALQLSCNIDHMATVIDWGKVSDVSAVNDEGQIEQAVRVWHTLVADLGRASGYKSMLNQVSICTDLESIVKSLGFIYNNDDKTWILHAVDDPSSSSSSSSSLDDVLFRPHPDGRTGAYKALKTWLAETEAALLQQEHESEEEEEQQKPKVRYKDLFDHHSTHISYDTLKQQLSGQISVQGEERPLLPPMAAKRDRIRRKEEESPTPLVDALVKAFPKPLRQRVRKELLAGMAYHKLQFL
jgi:hypothetical protein